MSMPNIPDIQPIIDIDEAKIIDLLLASIALEELGLAHMINAEAEKIQFVLGTLKNSAPSKPPTINELLEINDSVGDIMKKVIDKEILLQFKLEETVKLKTASSTTTSTTTTTTTTTESTSTSSSTSSSSTTSTTTTTTTTTESTSTSSSTSSSTTTSTTSTTTTTTRRY